MPPDAVVFDYIDIEEPAAHPIKGRGASKTTLTTLDENHCNHQSPPTTLTSVDDLEVSLGKSSPFQQRTPSSHRIHPSKDALSSSLSKSKTPIVICTDETIDVKYHIYYERELGRGTNTIVYKAIKRSTGKQYAVKMVKKIDIEETKHMRKEIDLLSDVSHRSIIDLKAAYEDSNHLVMVMEQCNGGELYQYVMDRVKTIKNAKTGQKEYKLCVNEATAAAIVRKVVDAVAYLHEHNIVHRDLKLENILFLSKHKPSVKADATMDTDVRLIVAIIRRYNRLRRTRILETDSDRGYTHSCDIWSIGILAYALLSAKPPFHGKNDTETCTAIKKGEYTFPSRDWDGISEEAKDFIRQLLVKDARQRPSALELRKHPWIKDSLKNDRGMTKKSGGFFRKVFGGKK
eukprot:scaffold32299_cov171-Skeletonema_menzelii.AAC.5